MAVWQGFQNFRHRMSKAFAWSQPYEPSSKQMLSAAAEIWRDRATGTPARDAAIEENRKMKSTIRAMEDRRRRLLSQMGQEYRPQH